MTDPAAAGKDTGKGKGKGEIGTRLFELIAGNYDTVNMAMSLGLLPLWKRAFRSELGLSPGRVLDVCAGTGWLTADIRRHTARGCVTGVDLCSDMLAVARRRLDRLGYPDVDLRVADAHDLPFPDYSFDVVTLGFALRNVRSIATVLSEMRRVLKPGGQTVIMELTHPPNAAFARAYTTYRRRFIPLFDYIAVPRHRRSLRPYRYLGHSVDRFHTAPDLAQVMTDAGFSDVRFRYLSWGVVAIHTGHR